MELRVSAVSVASPVLRASQAERCTVEILELMAVMEQKVIPELSGHEVRLALKEFAESRAQKATLVLAESPGPRVMPEVTVQMELFPT